jgi:hypothetical protein
VATDLVVAQQHEAPAGAHFVVLAGLMVAALAILGVRWWRGRRDGDGIEGQQRSQDRSSESTRSKEDE